MQYCDIGIFCGNFVDGAENLKKKVGGMMGETSWQVKARYNKKVYKSVSAQLDKELVARWEEKLQADGIGKAEFIRNAIKQYLGEE